MAYIIKKNNILDLIPSRGIGVNIPFNGTTGFNITYYTKDAIRTNLLNFLLTGKRERIMNPLIGSTIRNQIFEQINNGTIDNIEEIIHNEITEYFPSIKLEELSITSKNNTINIYLKYSMINTDIIDDLQIDYK